MWRKDNQAALARMDQSKILRRLRATFRQGTINPDRSSRHRHAPGWNSHRPGNATRAAANRDSAESGTTPVHGGHAARRRKLTCSVNRRNLHLWRAHKKGNALQPSRSRTRALLATQRYAGDAGPGEVADKRIALGPPLGPHASCVLPRAQQFPLTKT